MSAPKANWLRKKWEDSRTQGDRPCDRLRQAGSDMTTAGIRRPCLFCGVVVDPLVIDTTATAGTVILRCPECGGENTCQMIVLEGDMRGESALSLLPGGQPADGTADAE